MTVTLSTPSTIGAPIEVDASLLDAACDIAPLIREHSAEAERERRLSQPVLDALRETGLLRMTTPRTLGGLETDENGAPHLGGVRQLSLCVSDGPIGAECGGPVIHDRHFVHEVDHEEPKTKGWSTISSVAQLKSTLAELVIIILMVKFLESALRNFGGYDWEMLILPVGVLMLAASVRVLNLK